MEFVEGKYYMFVRYASGEPVEWTFVVAKENGEWTTVYPHRRRWMSPKDYEEYEEISAEELLILKMS